MIENVLYVIKFVLEKIDMHFYSQTIKDYFQHSPDISKLLKYNKLFGAEDKIHIYTEVLL